MTGFIKVIKIVVPIASFALSMVNEVIAKRELDAKIAKKVAEEIAKVTTKES
jgi:hypothetical protein